MSRAGKILTALGCLFLIGCAAFAYVAYRGYQVAATSSDLYTQARFLIQSGGTIGEAPAETTFSAGYLEAIFGDNPELLQQLKNVVHRGLAEDSNIRLGEVSAMVVTYRLSEEGDVIDVVAHVIGGFPLTRRKPGFHRDGYFKGLIDRNLWSMGNTLIGYLGRDMLLFAEPSLVEQHELLLESIFAGDIMPLVNSLERPLYYTAVFPDPRHVVPPRLRKHIQAVVVKGELSKTKGFWDALIITPSAKSAAYSKSILSDMKSMGEFALKTKWRGVKRKTAWGDQIDPWWAYELVTNMESATLEQEENAVRMHTDFDRVMVNVVLKCIERLSRDLAQMRYSMDDKLDPRLADAKLQTRKPQHYWMEDHRWGPNWPIPPPDLQSNDVANVTSSPEAETSTP